ncbi:MAG: competence protein ComEA [Myxococcota bacterium]|jgi:competence protein ComEA
MVALLLLVGAALLVRETWRTAPPVHGVLVEVRGDVPRPGTYRVSPPTVEAAVTAAGGGPVSAPAGRLRRGDRVEVKEDVAQVLHPTDPLLVALPIDLNTADATALASIPGVGATTAEAIVADRAARGPFDLVQDLARVSGIGPATVTQLAPFVTALPEGPPPPATPINVNEASAAQLERLPGIGPVLAARVVVDRDEHGPYPQLDDLQRVRGIGPALVERVRPYTTVPP